MRQCEIGDGKDETELRVESLGSVTLTELGTAARVGPTVRELAEGEIESEIV